MSSENPSPTESFVQQMLGTTTVGTPRADSDVPELNDALARLYAFRATWNAGDVIDEKSGLTADDLDVVTSFMDDSRSSD